MFKKYFLTLGLLSSSVAGFAAEKKVQEATKKSQQEVIEATDKNFESVVLKAEKPVIVDFGAEWCGPCKAIKPAFAQLAKEYGDKYIFVTIDIDEAKETAIKYNVSSVPTFIIIKDGITKGIYVGGIKSENFLDEVKKSLDADPAKGPISNAPQIPQEMLFLQAINFGNTAQVKALIQHGEVDVNYVFKLPMPNGPDMGKEIELTPLSVALSLSNKEMATILLDAGASVEQKFKSLNGNQVNIREFLQYNMDEAVKKGKEMLTFLDEQIAKSKK